MRLARNGRPEGFLRTQGLLLGLIGFMFLTFLAQTAFGSRWFFDLMVVSADVEAAWQGLLEGEISPRTLGEFGTLLSYAFLHGSIEHVAFNMLYFWIFGALICELLGKWWMLLIFVVTAICGGVAHVIMNGGDSTPMLGASGAVMGFQGAYLALATRWTLPDPHVWPIARPVAPSSLVLIAVFGVCVDYFAIMSGTHSNIAYGAHVGGFTSGLFIAGVAAPRPRVFGVVKR